MLMGNAAIFPATAMPDPEWWHALWPDPDAVIAAVGISGQGRVVDLCCGDGWFTLPLARVARRVLAIDLDPSMLQLTRARFEAAGVANCELIEGDAYDIGRLVGEPADVVLIANTFHGVPDKTRLAAEVARTLRPGGIFVIINWHQLPREHTTVLGKPRGPATGMRMEPPAVAAAVDPSGLFLAKLVELPPYHYAAVFSKSVDCGRADASAQLT
jgi:SAM-dependent methyltransferase